MLKRHLQSLNRVMGLAIRVSITSILRKLKDATPTLIEEYKAEAINNTSGLEGLAEICNNKVEKLAEISTEGTEKMAEYMFKGGSGKNSEYQDWTMKLNSVYMEEAGKITDVYLKSAY